MALSKIDVANMIENVAPESSIPDVSFRNIIINGDMSIAQRSTSVTSISSGNTIHTCDRWKTYASSAGTWTQTQEALTSGDPYTNGFATSLKLDCTTANSSLSSGSYLQIAQSIEAQNLQYIKKGTSNAEQLTASFWVKSTKTGTNILQFVSLDNTVRICAKSYTINSSDTWEKKTITIPADTSSTGKIDNNNGEGMRMIFWIAAGTDYTSGTLATTWADTANANRAVGQINNADSTSNNFEITGVQLEVGTSASDFEFLPHDVNLKRCLRYFEILIDGDGDINESQLIGSSYNSTRFFTKIFMKEYKRADATISSSNVGGTVYQDGGGHTVTALANTYTDTSAIGLDFTATTTSGDAGHLDTSSDTLVTADAEL
jgi:hypothetical protein